MKWIMKDCSRRSRHEVWFSIFGFKVYYTARATGNLWIHDDMIEMMVGVYYLNKKGQERWLIKPDWIS